MRLLITTPTAVVADLDDIQSVRAEDETGSFGILPRHIAFITALTISVVSWRDGRGREGHVAVRGGVLRVLGGATVEIATREAIAGDDLHALEATVLSRFRGEQEREVMARSTVERLELAAIAHIRRYLHPEETRHRAGPPAASINHERRSAEP